MFITAVNQVKSNYSTYKSPQFKGRAKQLKTVTNIVKSGRNTEAKALLGAIISAVSAFAVAKKATVNQQEQVNPNKKIKTVKIDNFNGLKRYELADMLRVSAPTIKFNFDKGLLVKGEDGKFSLDEPVNKAYINKYDEDIRRLCRYSDDEYMENYVDGLKKLLKNRVSENVYIVAQQFYDEPEEFSKYLKYSLSKIVDFNTLDSLQIKMLAVIFEEMIIDELNSENPRASVYYESNDKLDIMLYKHLLDELNFRNGNISNEEMVESEVVTKNSEGYNISEIRLSPKLDEIFEKVGQENEREIRAYRGVINKSIGALTDAYVQHNFIAASGNYYNLKKFCKEVLKRGLSDETDDRKIKIIVEKIFSQVGSRDFVLTTSYKNWKKEHKIRNAEDVVAEIINKYGNSLMANICTENALKELQKANPAMEIEMQHLEDIVREKFDL